jgi:chromosome segregation ATPase
MTLKTDQTVDEVNTELRNPRTTLTEQICVLDKDTAALEVQLQTARNEAIAANAEVAALEGELSAVHREAARQLTAAHDAALARQAESERLQARIEDRLRVAQAEIARHAEVANAVAAAQQAESERLRLQIGDLKLELKLAVADKSKAEPKIAELERELTAIRAKLAETTAQRDAMARILRQQTAVIGRLQRELLPFRNARFSQQLARVVLARVHPNVKLAIPTRVKQFIKTRMLGSG